MTILPETGNIVDWNGLAAFADPHFIRGVDTGVNGTLRCTITSPIGVGGIVTYLADPLLRMEHLIEGGVVSDVLVLGIVARVGVLIVGWVISSCIIQKRDRRLVCQGRK